MPLNQSEIDNNSERKPKLYQRKRFILPMLILILACGAIAVYWFVYLRGYVSTDDAYIDSDPVTLSSKILGRISQLTVDEGDSVNSGQLLIQLDDSDLKAQKAQAEANLSLAEQNVPLAEINLQKAQDDFDRSSIQYKDNIISQEQFDHAKKALETARAQSNVARAQVASSRAQIDVIDTQLKNTQIISSINGIVAKKWLMPGDIAQAGQPIFTIYDLENTWVTANFEETKLSLIHPNDVVDVSVDAYPDLHFEGKVILIGAAAASQFSLIPPNNASGNFTKVTQRVPIKISLNKTSLNLGQDKLILLPGMSAEVRIHTNSK